jgi:hypothetical protein
MVPIVMPVMALTQVVVVLTMQTAISSSSCGSGANLAGDSRWKKKIPTPQQHDTAQALGTSADCDSQLPAASRARTLGVGATEDDWHDYRRQRLLLSFSISRAMLTTLSGTATQGK